MAKGGFPRGMGMGGANMSQMIKQAQKMQEQMMKMQEEIEEKVFEATSGGGVVSVKVSGKKELKEVNIKPEAVDPDDVEMLQDMIVAAVNGALKMADDKTSQAMAKLQGGMPNLPGLF